MKRKEKKKTGPKPKPIIEKKTAVTFMLSNRIIANIGSIEQVRERAINHLNSFK